MKIKALPDRVLAHNIKRGERLIRGIILLDDDCKDHGIRPRWMQVYDVGSEINDVKVGEWVLVAHGRWTRGIKIPKVDEPKSEEDFEYVHQVDYAEILGVSETEPEDVDVKDTYKY